MRLRIWMLWGVLASLVGLPGAAIAQVNDAPSLAGVIDIHAHVAPETKALNFQRAFDAIEAAQIAKIYGMRGIVLKEHHTETAGWAYLVSRMVPDIEVFGGMGVSNDSPLAYFYAWARVLRIVDGPDAVHRRTVARVEMKKTPPYVG